MTATLDTADPRTADAGVAPRRSLGDISPRVAGLGAIGFATTVIAQNLLRGAGAPANDASSADVLTHYADHRTMTAVLVASYTLGIVSILVFLGGSAKRLVRSDRPGWAVTGLLAAVGVTALFAIVVGSEQALSVAATRDLTGLGAIDALWSLHNSVFTVLDVSIALALVGLSRAGISAGITPRIYRWLAPVGAGMLVVGTLAGPAIAAGDAMPLFGVAGLGFVVWLSFLISTGVRLVRGIES